MSKKRKKSIISKKRKKSSMSKKRKKKRKLKLGNIFLTLFFIVLLVLVVIYLTSNNFRKKVSDVDIKKTLKYTLEVEEKKEYTVSVITAGDNLIHSSLYNEAHRIANYEGYDFTGMYELIKPIVSEYDIAYYNQETILGGSELGLSDYPTFNSPYEVGDTMLDLGFNLVSLATNHTLDSGTKAVLNSRAYWDSKEDVLAVGSYDSEEARNEIHIMEKNNITYTMLNYTYGTNGISVPTGKEYLVNVWETDIDNINDPEKDTYYQKYKEQVKKDIEAVRDKVDVLIVAMHWGVEYTDEPTEYEKDMAEYLASLDVDIIVGTHPHVIQPVTWIDDTLVIYSLGNLISAQYQNESTCTNYKCTVGLMTSFDITKTIENGKTSIEISNIENELVYNYYNQSSWSGFRLIPFSNEEIVDHLSNYKEVYETYKEVVTRYNEDMSVIPYYE